MRPSLLQFLLPERARQESSRLPADVRRRWAMSLLFALSVVLSHPLDEFLLGTPSPITLPLRMAWSAMIVLHMGLWPGRGGSWWARPGCVERFGGTLQAENRSEGGARLRVGLPLHPATCVV